MALKHLLALVCCCVVIGSIQCDLIDFSDCGSEYELISMDIDGCNQIPCPMENKQSYKVTIRFKPKFKSSSLTQFVYLRVWDIDFKLAVTPDNPCSSLACPVHVSDGTTFVGTIKLNQYIVPMQGYLWWKMETESNRKAVCLKTPIKIIR